MFDLEQSIADWRRQMLAAGIQTPVPLEELEIHLREEIERQTKSGLDGQKAFEIATQQMGQANALKKEFKKTIMKTLNWKIVVLTFTAFAFINAVFDILAFSHLVHGELASIVWWIFNAPSFPLAVFCLRLIRGNPAGFVCFVICAGLFSALIWSVVSGFIFRHKNIA